MPMSNQGNTESPGIHQLKSHSLPQLSSSIQTDSPTPHAFHNSEPIIRPISSPQTSHNVNTVPATPPGSSYQSLAPLPVTNQICLCPNATRVPRPRNAFILYRQHHHAIVVAENPGKTNPEISKIIGVRWRSLSQREKDLWIRLGDEEKKSHLERFPDYRYQPRRNTKRNNSSGTTPDTAPGICPVCRGITSAPLSSSPSSSSTNNPSINAQVNSSSMSLSSGSQIKSSMSCTSSVSSSTSSSPFVGGIELQRQQSQPQQPQQLQQPHMQQQQPPAQYISLPPSNSPIAPLMGYPYELTASHKSSAPAPYFQRSISYEESIPRHQSAPEMKDSRMVFSSSGSLSSITSSRSDSGASAGSSMSSSPGVVLPRIMPDSLRRPLVPQTLPPPSLPPPSNSVSISPSANRLSSTNSPSSPSTSNQLAPPSPNTAHHSSPYYRLNYPPSGMGAGLGVGPAGNHGVRGSYGATPAPHAGPLTALAEEETRFKKRRTSSYFDPLANNSSVAPIGSSALARDERYRSAIALVSHTGSNDSNNNYRTNSSDSSVSTEQGNNELSAREKADVLAIMCWPPEASRHKKIIAIEGKDAEMCKTIAELLNQRINRSFPNQGIFYESQIPKPEFLHDPLAVNMWKIACLHQQVADAEISQSNSNFVVFAGYLMALSDELAAVGLRDSGTSETIKRESMDSNEASDLDRRDSWSIFSAHRQKWTESANLLRGFQGPDFLVYLQPSEGLTQTEVAVAELKGGAKMLIVGGKKGMEERIVEKIMKTVEA